MSSPKDARDQAAEFLGFAASETIELSNGDSVEIPNPGLLDDDQQERYDALQFELESCDYDDDIEIPERTVTHADGRVEILQPARTVKGGLKDPLRKNGQLLSPGYNQRLALAILGEEGYAKFKAAGGRAADVSLMWRKMKKQWDERQDADSKS